MLSVVPFEDHVSASPSPRRKKGPALTPLGVNTPGRKPGAAKDKEHTPTKLDLGAAVPEEAPVSATKAPSSAEKRCTMLQQVVLEARKTIEEQESVNGELPATEFSIHLVYSAWKAGRGNVGSRLKRLHPPALGLR